MPNTKFILLEGIEERNRFFSTYVPGKDQTRLLNGKVAYHILGYAETTKEAQAKLYGHLITETRRC